ncbi:hypothetical protein [Pseudovibrio sp. POLY-S9]|uniref:hypothetical protein n=1 Tax=Pseudovibrio sp. POLY-S9 TaxID=1576596 RepID=UPI00070BC7FF|nr:hypothetical protein [Pseudovibrio sp. POLY-S9]
MSMDEEDLRLRQETQQTLQTAGNLFRIARRCFAVASFVLGGCGFLLAYLGWQDGYTEVAFAFGIPGLICAAIGRIIWPGDLTLAETGSLTILSVIIPCFLLWRFFPSYVDVPGAIEEAGGGDALTIPAIACIAVLLWGFRDMLNAREN